VLVTCTVAACRPCLNSRAFPPISHRTGTQGRLRCTLLLCSAYPLRCAWRTFYLHGNCTFYPHFLPALSTCTFYLHFLLALFTCTFYLHFLPAFSTCTFYPHFLPALSTCTLYLHSLPALSTCTFYLHFLPALSTCTFYPHFLPARCLLVGCAGTAPQGTPPMPSPGP